MEKHKGGGGGGGPYQFLHMLLLILHLTCSSNNCRANEGGNGTFLLLHRDYHFLMCPAETLKNGD